MAPGCSLLPGALLSEHPHPEDPESPASPQLQAPGHPLLLLVLCQHVGPCQGGCCCWLEVHPRHFACRCCWAGLLCWLGQTHC